MDDEPEAVVGSLQKVHGATSVATSSVARAYSIPDLPKGLAGKFKHSPNCRLCMHPLRRQIDDVILSTMATAKEVWHTLTPEIQNEISIETILNHTNSHLPRDVIVRQSVLGERARDLGTTLEEAEGSIIDGITLGRMVIRHAASKAEQATVSEGLQAARFIHDVEREAGGDVDVQVYSLAFKRYLDVAQEIMPPEMFGTLIRRLREDPVVANLVAQRTPEAIEAQSH